MIGTAACAVGGFVAVVLTEPKRLFASMAVDTSADPSPLMPEILC